MLFPRKKIHNSKYWVNYAARFDGMQMSTEAKAFLNNAPWDFKAKTNGVGSQVGFLNKMICFIIPAWLRNCLWLLNITRASDIHDVEYDLPQSYKQFLTIAEGENFKAEADTEFRLNMRRIIGENLMMPFWFKFIPCGYFVWKMVVRARYGKAEAYYLAVKYEGGKSFWEGKVKPIK